jgi:hypothetical protein
MHQCEYSDWIVLVIYQTFSVLSVCILIAVSAALMDKFLLNINKYCRSKNKEDAPQTSGGGVKKQKCHKYDNSYLDFGFTSTDVNDKERPQCALCLKVLAPECMLPSKLKRHLETNHRNMVGKPCDFFTRKLKELKKQKGTFSQQVSIL